MPAGTYDIRIRYHAWGAQQNNVVINGASRDEAFPGTGSNWTVKTITGVALSSGTNTVAVVKGWGYVDIDYIEIGGNAPPPPPPPPTRIQAENGALSGSGISVRTDVAGYEGTGFVGTFTNAGDRLTVSFVNVPAGTYDIRIRYHAWGAQQNNVVINGALRDESFPGTGSNWTVKTITGVVLSSGTNTVAVVKDWGYVDIDYIEIGGNTPPPPPPPPTRIQAENGVLSGSGISVRTDVAGYEGTGFVGTFTDVGDRLTVSFVNVPAGTYDIRIRYHAWGAQQNNVVINSTSRDESFPGTGSNWTVKTITGVTLPSGTNTVAVVKGWGYVDIDYIEIGP